MKNLAVIQNTWTTLEMMQVVKITHFCIDTNYCKMQNVKKSLINAVSHMFPKAILVDIGAAQAKCWDTVVSTTFCEIVFATAKRIFVEDGTFDYSPDCKPKAYHLDADLYLFKPELSTAREYFKSVRQLSMNEAVSSAIVYLFDKKLPDDANTPVLFTAPPEVVHEEFVSDALSKYRSLIIKQHPRDERTFPEQLGHVVCSRELPGQVLTRLYHGPFLYEHNSTVKFEGDF